MLSEDEETYQRCYVCCRDLLALPEPRSPRIQALRRCVLAAQFHHSMVNSNTAPIPVAEWWPND